ncbi:hypothetical protein [Desulfallas thermosapovorans]|uniref:Uncharacterized protein n=1 Tax=Desulfallas thermosapovorans DSM 6562 TaxID=1121431 RepID=A0A5S4ZQI5_9FIRM|nr:hypothetical protein [Desulfallas thermosapovorans]TYO95155.1 hypothetical protein LX24_01884 [Desulfallas thermosapovorans DSM 6562]
MGEKQCAVGMNEHSAIKNMLFKQIELLHEQIAKRCSWGPEDINTTATYIDAEARLIGAYMRLTFPNVY